MSYKGLRCILSPLWRRFHAPLRLLNRHVSKDHHIVPSRALTDVLAVQLLYGGYHRVSRTSDSGTCSTDNHYAYEMNLIVHDAEKPRLHVCGRADWQWMRGAGHKLAEFLDVPVIDQLSHGD